MCSVVTKVGVGRDGVSPERTAPLDGVILYEWGDRWWCCEYLRNHGVPGADEKASVSVSGTECFAVEAGNATPVSRPQPSNPSPNPQKEVNLSFCLGRDWPTKMDSGYWGELTPLLQFLGTGFWKDIEEHLFLIEYNFITLLNKVTIFLTCLHLSFELNLFALTTQKTFKMSDKGARPCLDPTNVGAFDRTFLANLTPNSSPRFLYWSLK